MLYKDKKETINFLGELISYAYIFSAFFSSKLNMKVGYLLLIVSFLYICINKDIIKLVNKKIYGMFLFTNFIISSSYSVILIYMY